MPERGGPTTQSGVFYQNGIAALFLCMMMDERERDVRDDVVCVRVEGTEHVDDVEIRYGDGRRRFVQAKEKIRRGTEEWTAMWRHFATQRFSGDFRDGDRIELAIGNSSTAIGRLQEASERARGARGGTEPEEPSGSSSRETVRPAGELIAIVRPSASLTYVATLPSGSVDWTSAPSASWVSVVTPPAPSVIDARKRCAV